MITKSKPRIFGSLFIGLALFVTSACASLTITDVDYAQPVESVLEVGADGTVEDVRNGLRFNILPIQVEETGDGSSLTVEEVRLIRSQSGYYFITAPGFSNVYVFKSDEGSLVLENTILIDEDGIANPAFNQRSPNIQLIDGTSRAFTLTHRGIQN